MKKSLCSLKLYLVLDADVCANDEAIMLTTAISAVKAGVSMVQLRATKWKKKRWLSIAQSLQVALKPFHVPLIINDHVDVAIAVDADGVHVGQEDLPPRLVRQLIGPDKWLGLSVSCASELIGISNARVDYLGAGPVFATTSKPDAVKPIGLEGLQSMVQMALSLPVVAIGGIGASQMVDVWHTGVAGVAIISAICGQKDPTAATQALIASLSPKSL